MPALPFVARISHFFIRMRWAEISIRTLPESAEAITAGLLEIGCGGVSESSSQPGVITAHLPAVEGIQEKLERLSAGFHKFPEYGLPQPGEITLRYVDDQDWANEWKKHFKPLEIGESLVVKPTWEEYSGSRIVIEIDPGMAFGTGGHPSTRLCLTALERTVTPGCTVADIGTGSGILAIAAAVLGAGKVHATDIDSLPRRIAQENVTRSGLEPLVTIHEMDAFDLAARECDIVAANIIADTIIQLTPGIAGRLKENGVFISAGIVDDRVADVLDALRKAGFRIEEVLSEEIWRCVIARLET